jgi:RHS repeat-associated protein
MFSIKVQAESGLHQNWMRDYDPTTGRYLEPDPLGLVDSASVYGYARQNPGRWIDPRGQETILVCRPLDSWLGGDVGSRRQHCAAFVVKDKNDCWCDSQADPDGIIRQFSLAGGNQAFDDPGNPTDVYRTDRREYNTGEWPQTGKWPVKVPAGMTSCEFDGRVISEGIRYHQGEYRAYLGPNSNTAAYNLIRRAGGAPHPTNAQASEHGDYWR